MSNSTIKHRLFY